MFACVYGSVFAPFVEPIARDLARAMHDEGGRLLLTTIEQARARPDQTTEIERLYVLPFEPRTDDPAAELKHLFPRAQLINSVPAQELCWDKITTQERLIQSSSMSLKASTASGASWNATMAWCCFAAR